MPAIQERYTWRMEKHMLRVLRVACLGLFAALFLLSCATSRGSTLATVASAESGEKQQTKAPAKPPEQSTNGEDKKGLEVVSDPDKAELWIDGVFVGLTPFTVAEISQGRHQIVLRKSGYYQTATWIDFKGTSMVFRQNLVQITGFLLVSVQPEGSLVKIGGASVSPGLSELPVGTYTVEVRAFGYKDRHESVLIMEKAITELDVRLEPAAFDVTSFTALKTAVNPENPGMIGLIEASISVTGPGAGRIVVTDDSSATLYIRDLPRFTTWDQSVRWDVRDSSGRVMPDGIYTLSLIAAGPDGANPITKSIAITVDRTLKVASRSIWSGSAGLLYAPVAEVLPPGDFQISVLGVAYADSLYFRVPVQLGARIGAGSRSEIDLSAGLMPTTNATPIMASVTARWNLLAPRGAWGTGAAVESKLSFQFNPAPGVSNVLLSDTFANFTGISVGVPFQLSLGTLNLLLSPAVIASLWAPFRDNPDGSPAYGLVTWMYLRAGVMLDLGEVTAGISASTRTQPLPGGVAFMAWPAPIQAGAEIHWLIPGTRLLISAMAAGEYEPSTARTAESYYFMGGGGLGFLY
jgi:hypothetical protein